ncbi:MAG: flagellar hook-length control protein FliK [Lachnospiraceae bacterium]|nr:flagellar hook-length control protein FliK [Lachnospiraceae bacterium]
MNDISSLNTNTSVNISLSGTQVQGVSGVSPVRQDSGQTLTLSPGDILKGTVLGSDQGNVTLSLGNGATLSAVLADGVNLTEGALVSLAVRGKTDSGSVLLSALNTNTAGGSADGGLMKAIGGAGLEINDRTVLMVRSMMEEGMPINNEAIRAMSQSLADIPTANIKDAVELMKMGLQPSEENIQQLNNYKEAEYRIEETAKDIGQKASDALIQIADTEGSTEAVRVLKNVLTLVSGEDSVLTNGDNTAVNPREGASAQTAVQNVPQGSEASEMAATGKEGAALAGVMNEHVPAGEVTSSLSDALMELGAVTEEQAESLEKGTMTKGELTEILRNIPEKAEIPEEIKQFIQKTASSPEQAAKALAAAENAPGREGLMNAVLKNPVVKQLVQDSLAAQMMVTPEETGEKENVRHLYERMLTQSDKLQKVMGKAAGPGTELGQSLEALNNNVKFINNINEAFPYIQLPVRMDGGEAHGDLYVYTNKKGSLAEKDEVTALLHLDMDHLGQLDVYLTLKDGDHLGTHFYLEDDETLDLIAQHMDQLEKGMEKRGYVVKTELSTRDKMAKPADILTDKENKPKVLSFNSFDARA